MTRCLNCGAERLSDTCDACGLSSSAAEFSLRRSLLNRTALFLVGAIAFIVASGRYPALELDGIVIFIGVVFFLTLGLAIIVERRALRHQEVESLKRVYYGLLPLPWLLALLLYGNGALDRSPAHGKSPRNQQIFDDRSGPQPPPHRQLLARRPSLRTHPSGSQRFRPLHHRRRSRRPGKRRPSKHPLGSGRLPRLTSRRRSAFIFLCALRFSDDAMSIVVLRASPLPQAGRRISASLSATSVSLR
jgi:hypothetical protein